jgi:hypothetical protein
LGFGDEDDELQTVSHLHWSKNELQNAVLLSCIYVVEQPSSNRHCDGVLYATYRILFIALVTCLPTYRTIAGYFEFLSQLYGFHLIHPRRTIWDLLCSHVIEVHLADSTRHVIEIG